MIIDKIYGVYFSPTYNTFKIVRKIVEDLAKKLEVKTEYISLNKPSSREVLRSFSKNDLLVIGLPTYAGRLPNKIAPFLNNLKGDNTPAISVVTYGNRSFDNSLAELNHFLLVNNFKTFLLGAFVSSHPFSSKLGKDRPNQKDLEELDKMIELAYQKIRDNKLQTIEVEGKYDAPYYTPLKEDGMPANF